MGDYGGNTTLREAVGSSFSPFHCFLLGEWSYYWVVLSPHMVFYLETCGCFILRLVAVFPWVFLALSVDGSGSVPQLKG